MPVSFHRARPEEKDIMKRVYGSWLEHFGSADLFSVDLEIVGKDKIRTVNREARGVDKPTDVLSFPALDKLEFPVDRDKYRYDTDPETNLVAIGEILICRVVMEAQGKEYGHGTERECAYLFLHGLLHLTGFDHETEEGKNEMREAEEAILTAAGYPVTETN